MFADIPSDYFGLNYDPSHPVLLRMDYLKPLKEFAGKLFHIHAKDVLFDRAQCDDWGFSGYRRIITSRASPATARSTGRSSWAPDGDGLRWPCCIEVEDETFGKSIDGRKRAVKVARNVLAPFFA
jgi:sugar phosphate isomerase/epimerase